VTDQKEQEVIAQLANPKYFIESCLSIVDKNSQQVPFLWRKAFANWWENHTNNDFIVKARKMGFTAGISAIWLHACIFKQNTRAVVVSFEKDAAQKLLERVKYYIKTCEIPIRIGKNSEHEIYFPDTNSSFWSGTAGQRAFGRGDDITHSLLSEICHYEKLSVITGLNEAMRNDGMIVRESTANGSGTESHALWLKAISNKKNNVKSQLSGTFNYPIMPHFYGWNWDDEYCIPNQIPFELTPDETELKKVLNLSWGQIMWARIKKENMDKPEEFPQEYPASWQEAFLTSGQTVFKWQDIKRQEAGISPIKWHGDIVNNGGVVVVDPNPRGNFKVWRTARAHA
jgi:hypothetical protein